MAFILHRTSSITSPLAALLLLVLTLSGCQMLGKKPPTTTGNTVTQSASSVNETPDEASGYAAKALQLEQQQQNVAALDVWLAQTPLLMDDGDMRANSRNVWRVLSQMRNDEFAQLLRREHAQLLGGWVSLAYIQRLGSSDLEKQAEQLQDWQRSWPMHPANRYLPEDMKLLRRLKEDQPKHIALLLPFSGKRANVGQAIRDGFLAAYYRSLAAGAPAVTIDMIDTESSPDILSLYGAAVAGGAQLVIGPVEREQVQVLANEPALAVPVLALNEVRNQTPANLYQFSLNPEEEAIQTANAARASQFQRALIITGDNERGRRLAERFEQQWKSLGGSVSAIARYSPERSNYNEVIGQVLADPAGTAKRRQDIDMVFLVGKSKEASQVLPSLAFHYADDLPVYGLSDIYDPQQAISGRDLDGVHLCLTPWQAGKGGLTTSIQTISPPAAGLDQLYAMGADSQPLYIRLALMEANPNLAIDGHTGYLRLNKERHITRGLVWAVMQNGRPAPLPDIVQ